MSSAHESGYPNEIQCGNVEDHLTFFTRVRAQSPLSRFPSRNENAIFSDYLLSVRFRQVSDMAACCIEPREVLRKKNIKMEYVDPQIYRVF